MSDIKLKPCPFCGGRSNNIGDTFVTGRRTAEDVMAVVEAAIERKRERIKR